MVKSSPHWASYCTLMACCLVELNNILGLRLVGIGETLCQALSKIVMREAGYYANMACENLQLCAGCEASIEGVTFTLGDWSRYKGEIGTVEVRY